MRMYPREFPANRRGRPKRRAERRVYEALAGNDRQGFCYYEWRKGYEHIELDFAVWVEGLGRFALQVKGGRYVLIDGEWRLKTRTGVKSVRSCPLDEAKLSALDLHDDIEERACTTYNPYVIPVLIFPDMEPDPAIESLAKRTGVYVIWGVRNLWADLEEIVRSRRVSEALGMDRIAREVHAVTDGLIRLENFEQGCAADATDQPVPVPERRQCTGALRLTLVGVDVTMTRARGVRPAG